MKRLNAFLSSAMTGELAVDRSALRIFFKTDPTLLAFADLYAIEELASSQSIERAYVEEVKDSHVVIILLNKELRAAVEKEFKTAQDNGARLLIFIRERTDNRDPALSEFIANHAYRYHCGSYSNEIELCAKVRLALVTDLLNSYRRSASTSDQAPPIVQLSRSPTEGTPLFDAAELDTLRANPEVAKLEPGQLVALAMMIATERWDFKTALMLLDVAITEEPDNWQAFHNKGQLLSDIGMARESRMFLERALELNPRSDPTLHNLGIFHYRAGDWDKAREYFDRALALVPDKHSSLSYLVNLALQEGRYPDAEAYARRALQSEQGDLERGNLALACALNGKLEEARELLRGWSSRSREFLRVSAYVEELAGDLLQAIARVDEFNQAFGLERQLCVKKAFLLLTLNRVDELKAWIAYSEKHVPYRSHDYNNLGWQILQQTEDCDYAASLLEKALAIDPTEAATWRNLQCCYQSDARLPDAVAVSRRALEYHPHDPGIFGNMARALLRSGQLTEFADMLIERSISVFGGFLTEEQRADIRREAKANPTMSSLPELEKLVQAMLSSGKSDHDPAPTKPIRDGGASDPNR